jgi:hypothetical protein
MNLSAINWLAVFISALAFFGFGALWYGPLFGKTWQKATDISDETLKSGQTPKIFGASLVMALVITMGMELFLRSQWAPSEITALSGAMLGILLGIFFILPTTAMNYIFARRPVALILIDAFYHMLAYAIAGLILGAWS